MAIQKIRRNPVSFLNLREWIDFLKKEGDLAVIDTPVDPKLEIPEIHRRVIEAQGPALLFTRVKGSPYPVATNLFGTKKRVDQAFGPRPERLIRELAALPHELMPPTLGKLWGKRHLIKEGLSFGIKLQKRKHSVLECGESPPDLTKLPALTSWSQDGGPFLTLPLVHTHGSHPKPDNLGMYRIQIHGPTLTGLHFQIGKGGGYHLDEAEKANRPLPVSIYLGGPPALILSAIAPLPENVPELLLTSLVMGKKLSMGPVPNHPLPAVNEAEFCLVGECPPGVRQKEGPFGDHYGYYSLAHDFPVFQVKTLYHKKNPIFPATVVGKPRQEDFYLGDYLQGLLSPLFPLVMPGVVDLWSYGETGYHSLTAAVLRDRYEGETLVQALRILGEGQLSLTKCLIGIDRPMDLKDFPGVLTYLLERIQWEKDLLILSQTSMDTLDYTGPRLNRGSKAVFFASGDPVRSLPRGWDPIPGFPQAQAFCPGCLVVQDGSIEALLKEEALTPWPLIILVDNLKKTLKDNQSFLWTVFTRFNPASDIFARSVELRNHQVIYKGPILIDARMKPSYPEELFCDPKTEQWVDQRWKEYFS
jgi:UbiD family decarboxylase